MATTLDQVMLTGLDASKPAAGSMGRLYFATDTNKIYRDTGSAWNLEINGGVTASGYTAGTVPAVVQVASTGAGGNSVTFPLAPTSGNLLLAMSFSPTAGTVGTGWTLAVANTGGSDFGLVAWKVAGASEPATQTPVSSGSANGCMVVWEISGQHATNPIVVALSQGEQTGATSNTPILIPNSLNCLGLSAVSLIPTPTFTAEANVGTQDVLINSTVSRYLCAGHSDLRSAPMVGIVANFSASASSKGATVLVTS